MQKIKIFFAVAIVFAATFVGYNTYKQSIMTDEERLMQANIEALTNIETITMICKNQYLVAKCIVTCSNCNMTWEAFAVGPYSSGSSTCTCGNIL